MYTYFLLIFLLFRLTDLNALELPAIMADNMVLQQQSEIVLWGKATPDSEIQINAGWGEQVVVQADAAGDWQGSIKTPVAGGPYALSFQSGTEQKTINNVMIGEVWLCSGQSNMAMPLSGWPPNDTILGAAQAIRQANYSTIRFFTVNRATTPFPAEQCEGSWVVCSPETARSFSATAYFFGKKLHEELDVPIGLIHSSWGGTPVESWMSQEKLTQFDDFRSVVEQIQKSKSKIRELEAWLADKQVVKVNEESKDPFRDLHFNDEHVSEENFKDTGWPKMELPQFWDSTDMGNFDGVVWFRKSITVPENWQNQDLMLELGPIDDMDITYWNGHRIGAHEQEGFWNEKRKYSVPADVIHKGDNIIAVRVTDHQGGGGLYGDPSDMAVYPVNNENEGITLAGKWKYLPVAEYQNGRFCLFHIATMDYFNRPSLPFEMSPGTPSFLYNAMIHPLIPYRIKGVIWYQGESNTGNPEQYDYLFPGLINDWREQWRQDDFPFYYVQIAPYDYGEVTRSQRLREAQLKALKTDNTGMVVTMDIGDPANIHPANKTAVGERLARWALAKDYNKDMKYSGPIYNGMKVDGNAIVLRFKHAENGLETHDKSLQHFMIAGKDRQFYPARAEIHGNEVVVSSPSVKDPVAVRYAWDNTSEASLFNAEGLPASSFRTDDWE